MSLYDKIVALRPELTVEDFHPAHGVITIQDDSDGFGPYISKWEHSAAQPSDEELGITRNPETKKIIEGEVIAPVEMAISEAKLDMSQFRIEPAAE